VILGGLLLAAVTYYPLYTWLGSVTQPGNVNYPIAIIIVAILVAYGHSRDDKPRNPQGLIGLVGPYPFYSVAGG